MPARHLFSLHDGQSDPGREDREGHPVRTRCARRVRRSHRLGSATHIADVKAGDSVAVIGIGGVGMSALQGAVASGARHVFAIDPVPWKREQALKFGATHAYASIEEAIVPIMEITWGRMCQKTIITVGEMTGDLVDPSLTLTAKGGKCVVTAMGYMADMDVKLNSFLFSMLQKDLKGNIFGGCNARVDIPNLLDLYRSGQLNLATWSRGRTTSIRSTTATRTCSTARTSAASSDTPKPTGDQASVRAIS